PVVVEDDLGPLQPAEALDVDCLGAVDEDVADVGVLQQRLQRPQTEGFVEHLGDQPLAFAQAEQVRAEAAQFLGGSPDLAAQLVLAEAADGGQVHAADQTLVQLALVAEEALLRAGWRPGRDMDTVTWYAGHLGSPSLSNDVSGRSIWLCLFVSSGEGLGGSWPPLAFTSCAGRCYLVSAAPRSWHA